MHQQIAKIMSRVKIPCMGRFKLPDIGCKVKFPNLGLRGSILTEISPSIVSLSRRGYIISKDIKKKSEVREGAYLGSHEDTQRGDLFATISGIVTALTDDSIVISKSDVSSSFDNQETFGPELFGRSDKATLIEDLKKYGIDTSLLTSDAQTIIVNTLSPDPAITWQRVAFAKNEGILLAGCAIVANIYSDRELKLAVSADSGFTANKFDAVIIKDASYPAGLDPLVVANVTGVEKPDGVIVLPMHFVWQIGRVAVTRRPILKTIFTLGSNRRTYQCIAPIGTIASDAFASVGLYPKQGDSLSVNGILRGKSWFDPNRGIAPDTEGIFLNQRNRRFEYRGDGPCMNCGACVEVCPARLDPGALSRFAEMNMLDDCKKHYIEYCLDCGMCTYICPAMRPVLQYINSARQKIEKI